MNERIKEIAGKLIDDCIIFKVWRNGKDNLCIEEEEFYLPNEVRSRFFSSDLGAAEGQILYYNDRIEIVLNFWTYFNDEPYCDDSLNPIIKTIKLATVETFDEAQRIKNELKAKGVPSVYPDWKSRIGSEFDKQIGGVL